MEMTFTWDAAKDRNNQRAHGISFETAKEVFGDPHQVVFENYYIEHQREQR